VLLTFESSFTRFGSTVILHINYLPHVFVGFGESTDAGKTEFVSFVVDGINISVMSVIC